jgi:protein TonB
MAGFSASTGIASQGIWVAAGLSAAVHLALAGWVAATGLFARAEERAAPAGPKVELISAAAFDALQSVAPAIEASVPDLIPPPPVADLPRPDPPDREGPAPQQARLAPVASLSPPSAETAPLVSDGPPAPPERRPAAPPAPESQVPERDVPQQDEPTAARPENLPEPEGIAAPATDSAPAVKPVAAAKAKPVSRAKGASADKGDTALLSDWGGRIRSKINRAKSYPRAERVAGVTGTVTLRLTISRDGQIVGLSVVQGSGSDALDAAAVAAVRRAGRLPNAPGELEQDKYTFSLPVTFTR